MTANRIYDVYAITRNILDYEEGYCEVVYRDSLGYPTIGKGLKLGPKDTPLKFYKLLRMSEEISDMYVQEVTNSKLLKILSTPMLAEAYEKCNGPRRAVLLSMAYQMGTRKLSKFKKTIGFICDEDWFNASVEMLDSVWAKDETSERAMRHSSVMSTGLIESVSEYTCQI